MDVAVGSTAPLHSVQDPTGAPPPQPKTAPSAAETVAESSQRAEQHRAPAAEERIRPQAGATPRETTRTRDLPPPPPESGRGQLVDIAA